MLVSFIAMYLLVSEWTGLPAAAIVAASLFAFHEVKLKDTVHFYAFDSSWTVLALFFTSRLFTRSRWRDAIGLAFAITMQLTGSFYPVIAGLVIAPPVLAWLAIRNGVRQLVPAQWIFLALWTLIVAWAVFAPYLELSESGVLEARPYQIFSRIQWLAPGGPVFPGWISLGLVAACLALPRRLVVSEASGDPRWMLLTVALLLVWLSFGGNTAARLDALAAGEPLPPAIPDLYAALSTIVPGLDKVRGPAAVWCGVHLILCLLSGLGAAALLRVLGEPQRLALSIGLLILVLIEIMRPGLEPRLDYVSFDMRPPEPELALFDALAEAGNDGPLLELPFDPDDITQSSRAVLVGAYHGRRTSQCLNSFLPPEVIDVKRLTDRLPQEAALRELAALGFTTIVIHADPPAGALRPRRRWQEEFDQAAPELPIRRIGTGVAEGTGIVVWDMSGASNLQP
jgi:hypothetical protein